MKKRDIKKPLGVVDTLQQAVAKTGLERVVVRFAKQSGCDAFLKGSRVDCDKLVEWVERNRKDLEEAPVMSREAADIRLKLVRHERARFELDKAKGEYLPKKETLAEITRMSRIKKAFLQAKLERELPPKLIGLDVHQITDLMQKTVDEVCGTMHDPSFYKPTYLPCVKCGHTPEAQ